MPSLESLAQPGAEESLRPQNQHEEERRKGHTGFDIAAKANEREDLDEAKQVPTQHGAGNAAHATEDDHGQALQIDLVAADVGTDIGEREAKEQPGQPAQRGRHEEGRGEDSIDVDPE